MNNFVHLHLHTEYSLLDGAAGYKKVIKKAYELGMPAVAITDHGSMYGVIDFYTEAKKYGIKPVIGCEVYTAPASRFDKTAYSSKKPYCHLVLLCKNETGYKNLMALVTKSNTEGFYYKPRIDMELLRAHSEGLIALSACIRGDVPMAFLNSGIDAARKKAEEFIEIFGKENFFLEIQHHGIEEEDAVRRAFVKLSAELGVGLVATNDVHYVEREDSLMQDVLSCIQTGKKLSDEDRMKMHGDEYYFKSAQEMAQMFADVPASLENTLKIADMCNLDIDMSTVHLPKININSSLSHDKYLENLCMQGMVKKYGTLNTSLTERLNYELDVINSMGYTDYFLVVHDFIKYAKEQNIPIGPGRGSAAGSIVAYALDITEIDPVSNGLIFERFLNPERVSMPDIDIDICFERRDEVREYVASKYGNDRVSQIVTFGTMAAKAAIKDVARVMGVDIFTANKISKAIPNVLHITLKDALETSGELREMYTADARVKNVIDIAMDIEGFPRHTSVHAAGVVIGDDVLSKYVPLSVTDGGLVTQYPMGALEKIGLLKMDFLGLRNLTVINDTVNAVNKSLGLNIDIKNIPLDDEKTFELIKNGDTDAVFQLENPGLQSFMRKFRPSAVDDIVITTSIYRPGPMDQIPQFLKNVKNPGAVTYRHPLLKSILEPTYGVVVYQEQVMAIVRTLAGYSMGRADLVRRAMAKKKMDVMEQEREIFLHGLVQDGELCVEGALRRGVDEKCANEIFDSLIDFANYAFNKSHAACYALVAYRTAYLKANYPTFYLASVLKNYAGYQTKAVKYIASFKKYGISLLPPDVNKSFSHFVPEDGNIRFGLCWIKNAGMNLPANIVKERRQNGEFTSFTDFIKRMSFYDINKRSVEAMIKCGCFDSVYPNRRVLIFNYEKLVDDELQSARDAGRGQVSWLSMEEPGDVYSADTGFKSADYPDYSKDEKLGFEQEVCGMYFSGHPLDKYAYELEAFGDISVSDAVFNSSNDGKTCTICGRISDFSVRNTKSGRPMANMNISDFSAMGKMIAFEASYLRFKEILKNGSVIVASVNMSYNSDDEVCEFILNSAMSVSDAAVPKTKTLYVKTNEKTEFNKIKEICADYKGNNSLCVYVQKSSEVFRLAEGVCLCRELFDKLTKHFGSENVKIK